MQLVTDRIYVKSMNESKRNIKIPLTQAQTIWKERKAGGYAEKDLLWLCVCVCVCLSEWLSCSWNGTFWTSPNEPRFRQITERLCLPGGCPELSAVNETERDS